MPSPTFYDLFEFVSAGFKTCRFIFLQSAIDRYYTLCYNVYT